MTTTTIKVSSTTRDRLKAQASAAHRTLGAYLDDLADLADRQSRFAGLKRAIGETSAPDLVEHADETAEWERAEWADVDRDR